jgi:hypothetical protein
MTAVDFKRRARPLRHGSYERRRLDVEMRRAASGSTEWCAIQFAVQSDSIIARSLFGVEFCNALPRTADVSVWCEVREVPSSRFRDATVAVG